MSFPTGWTHKFTLTIDRSKVVGTPTGFVLLVTKEMLPATVIDAGSTSAQDGGGDIRFTNDSAGTQRLPIEVVDFHPNATSGNRRCEIWVNMSGYEPTTSTDKVIYGWCKAPNVMQQPGPSQPYGSEAVWTSLDHRVVLHMNDGQPITATGLWLVRPRAVEYNGATYYVWLDATTTKLKVGKYVHTTGLWSAGEVASAVAIDGHCAPSIYADGSGYLYVLDAGYTTNNNVRVFRSSGAESIAAWGSAVNVTTSGSTPAYPVGLTLSGGNQVVFWRQAGTDVKKAFSTDNGATWSSGQTVTSSTWRPYFTVHLGASDRVHLAYDLQNLGTGYRQKIVYAYSDAADSDTATWKAIDGTTLTLPLNNPATVAGGMVFDYSVSWNRGGYFIGFDVDSSNNPLLGAGLFDTTNTDKLAVWEYSSSAWNQHDIVTSDEINIGATENRSEGDVRWVSSTTWRCVFQRTISSRWEIKEYESTDAGSTWSLRYDLTQASTTENVQPQYVRDSSGPVESVWFSGPLSMSRVAETYNSAKDLWWAGSHTDGVGVFALGAVPASTSYMRDSTKYRHHASKQSAGNPAQATGLIAGYAQTFNSSSQVSLGTSSNLHTDKPMTDFLWAKPTNATSGLTEHLVGTGSVNDRSCMYRSSSALPSAWISNGSAVNVASDSTSWGAGVVKQLANYWDGTTVRLRVNNAAGSTTASFSGNAGGTAHLYLSGTNRWVGQIDEYRRWPSANADLLDTMYANANSPGTFASGSDATLVAISQVIETDTAQAFAAAQAKAIAQATEQDTALSLQANQARAIGQVVESDSAQAFTVQAGSILGQVTETNIAQSLTPWLKTTIGQTTEIDTAQPVARLQTATVALALEIDTAHAFAASVASVIAQVTETDTAQLFGSGEEGGFDTYPLFGLTQAFPLVGRNQSYPLGGI